MSAIGQVLDDSGEVHVMGLDFGTTTSSAVVARASLARNAVTGRTDLRNFHETFRSELVFTPMTGARLDLEALEKHLDTWLAAVAPERLFGGGALLTGLTARRDNAHALLALIRRRLAGALVAAAEDPCLESWLAFLGSCADLSRRHPDRPVLNLDIGGGTTNLALGQDGEVRRTGCLFIGARHVQVRPGTYRIVRLSDQARAIFRHLHFEKGAGGELTQEEVEAFLAFQTNILRCLCAGDDSMLPAPLARELVQTPFRLPPACRPLITFSGGVGQLIYDHLRTGTWPETTCFGDVGIDLAQRVVALDAWGPDWRSVRPSSGGRATVFGLLRHSTHVSGSTVFLPRPELLPLGDVPILGTVAGPCEDLSELLRLAARGTGAAALRVEAPDVTAEAIQNLARRLRHGLDDAGFPMDRPLVLLLRQNAGKVLGHAVTHWGQAPYNILVLDELDVPDAHYVHVGAPRHGVIPVSFYGLREAGEPSWPG